MLVHNKTQLGQVTIRRNEEFGEYTIAGVEWTAYVTISKKGRLIMDSYIDRGGIGILLPFNFLEDYREDLINKKQFLNFYYQGIYVFIIYCREEEQFHVANVYIRKEPFAERDMQWMQIYTQANVKITELYLDLLKQQEYINTTFNSLSAIIMTIDAKGSVLLYNYPAAVLFDLEEESIGKTTIQELLPKDVWQKMQKSIKKVQETNHQVVLKDILLPKEDVHRIFTFTLSPLHSTDQRKNDIILVAQDVTSQKLLDQELEKRAQYEVLSDVAVGLAHDIKNPLTNILGCARIGTRPDCKTETRAEMMNIISHEVSRITKVLNQMLSYGKLTQHSPEKPLDVNSILETCLSVAERQKFERKIRITADLEDGMPRIIGSEMQLQQVFLNILINALEAISDSGTISVRSRYSKAENDIRIDIVDDGVGISPAFSEKVFSPYFTTKKNGTGLGLFSSKRAVEQLGGTIRLLPGEKGGTHCQIVFPVKIF